MPLEMETVETLGAAALHLTPSERARLVERLIATLDADPEVEEAWAAEVERPRYKKKFQLARKYMFTELFAWLPPSTHIEQIAVFYNHPRGRDKIAGATIMSIDELMAEIRSKVIARGPMISNAISEQYPLLRTIQM